MQDSTSSVLLGNEQALQELEWDFLYTVYDAMMTGCCVVFLYTL